MCPSKIAVAAYLDVNSTWHVTFPSGAGEDPPPAVQAVTAALAEAQSFGMDTFNKCGIFR